MGNSERLREAIEQVVAESQLSYSTFARQARMSREQLGRILSGETKRPQDQTLRRIAEAAGRDLDALIRVRDEGVPLEPPAGDDESQLARRVAALERQVGDMATVLREVRDFMRRDDDGPDEAAR